MAIGEYKFSYRLFASVDLAGSTAFKQSDPNWVHVFDDFFELFPKFVEAKHAGLAKNLRGRPDHPLAVWKFVGDEILMSVELKRYEQACVHLGVLLEAIDEYTEEMFSAKHRSLSLKACAWTGGFPVQNSQVHLGRSEATNNHSVVDYLGPAIDLGFRIARFAGARRVPINVELAYLLAKGCTQVQDKYSHTIYMDDEQSLKGVNGGRPYPVLWIDRLKGADSSEDKLRGLDRDSNPVNVIAFCKNFFACRLNASCEPFIHGDKDETIGRVPDDMEAKLEALRREDPEHTYERAVGAVDDRQAEPGGDEKLKDLGREMGIGPDE